MLIGGPGVERQAPLLQRAVLGAVGRMLAIVGVARRVARAACRRHRGHAAVGRIDHERREEPALEPRDAGAAIEPEIGDAARRVRRRTAVAAIAIVARERVRHERLRLLRRELRLVRQIRRPLERRERREAPDAFEIAPVARRRRTRLRRRVAFARGRSVGREREQHVARPAAERAVARVHEQHAADDDGTGSADRRAVRLDAVHRLELAVGVELPEQRSVLRRPRRARAPSFDPVKTTPGITVIAARIAALHPRPAAQTSADAAARTTRARRSSASPRAIRRADCGPTVSDTAKYA